MPFATEPTEHEDSPTDNMIPSEELSKDSTAACVSSNHYLNSKQPFEYTNKRTKNS